MQSTQDSAEREALRRFEAEAAATMRSIETKPNTESEVQWYSFRRPEPETMPAWMAYWRPPKLPWYQHVVCWIPFFAAVFLVPNDHHGSSATFLWNFAPTTLAYLVMTSKRSLAMKLWLMIPVCACAITFKAVIDLIDNAHI